MENEEFYESMMDGALLTACEKGHSVRLYLANGVQMVGKIEGFDPESIAIRVDKKLKLVCRSRLSTLEVLE